MDTILTKTHPGSIILDHDGGGNRQQTLDALTVALPRLIDAGYHHYARPDPAGSPHGTGTPRGTHTGDDHPPRDARRAPPETIRHPGSRQIHEPSNKR